MVPSEGEQRTSVCEVPSGVKTCDDEEEAADEAALASDIMLHFGFSLCFVKLRKATERT